MKNILSLLSNLRRYPSLDVVEYLWVCTVHLITTRAELCNLNWCIHNTFVLCVFVFVLYICICVFEWNIYECSLSILRRWQNSAFWIGFKRSVVLPKVNDKQLKRNTFLKWMKLILDLSEFTNIPFVYLFWWTCIFHYNVLRVQLVPVHQVSTVRTIFYLYVINGFIDLNWANQCIICIAYMLHVKWELEGL